MAKAIVVDAVLFDMDGTLIDSTPGVISAWNRFGEDYGLDVPRVIEATHGVRLVESLVKWCRITDEKKLQEEVIRFENLVIEGGPALLPGVTHLLEQLNAGTSEDKPGWTIVTSATNGYAPFALKKAGIIMPPTMVTSDDVSRGKPHPDPYLEGARRCQVDPTNCLVVEDAPSGIRSGHAAGSKTLAVLTSHSREQMVESETQPDFIVDNLTRVSAKWLDGKIELTILE